MEQKKVLAYFRQFARHHVHDLYHSWALSMIFMSMVLGDGAAGVRAWPSASPDRGTGIRHAVKCMIPQLCGICLGSTAAAEQ